MDNIDIKLREKAKQEQEKLPNSFENRINEVLKNLPNTKKKSRRPMLAASIAAALFIVPIVTVYGKEAALVNNVVEFFKGASSLSFMGDSAKYERYSKAVGKTITDKGISITIDNIACDDNFVAVFYTAEGEGIKTHKELDDIEAINFIWGQFKLNGKKLAPLNNNRLDGYITEDGRLKGMIRENVGSNKLPESFKLDFSVDTAFGIKGEWNFKMEVSKEEAFKDSKVVNVNKEFYVKYPDREHKVNIEKVSITPFGNQIILNDKYIKGNDKPFWLFALYDDQGKALDVLGTDLHSSNKGARNSFEFLKATKDTKSITLVPIYTYSDNAPKEINYNPVVELSKFPLELKMSSKGSLIIDKVEFGDKETKIYYRKQGIVIPSDNPFNIYDETGKDVFNDVKWFDRSYIEDREKGIYVRVLPKLDKNKKYKLEYFTDEKFELLHQYKVEIPLN